jgi:hypothetical protein
MKTYINLSGKLMKHKKLNEKIVLNEKSFQFKEAIIYNFNTKVFIDSFSQRRNSGQYIIIIILSYIISNAYLY